MLSPLDRFIADLSSQAKCEDSLKRKFSTHTTERFSSPEAVLKCELTLQETLGAPPVSSLPTHTHTSEGFPNTDAAMKCETKCEGPLTLPEPPLQPGWLVAYRDRQGRLRGGCDEREAGTVHTCEWDGTGWTIRLTNGDALPLRLVVSVGKTDATGKTLAIWATRAHGYDGEGLR